MQMVGNSLKNFFKCLVYIFVPLGCIFLGFLFGVQLFLNELVTQADYIAVQLSELVDGTEAQVDNLIGFVIASLRELDWSEPLGTLTFLMDGDWIAARIAEFLQLTVEEAAALEEQVVSIAANVAMALLADLVALVLCVAASVVIGYFVTNYFVRKSTVRRGFWGFWIASIADAVLTVTLIAFVTWLMTVSTAGAVLSGIAGRARIRVRRAVRGVSAARTREDPFPQGRQSRQLRVGLGISDRRSCGGNRRFRAVHVAHDFLRCGRARAVRHHYRASRHQRERGIVCRRSRSQTARGGQARQNVRAVGERSGVSAAGFRVG